MPKINAKLSEVSTEFKVADPATYELLIKDVTLTEASGRQTVKIKLAIDEPGDWLGHTFQESMSLHKKTGEENEAGMRQLKSWFEAVVGAETTANWSDDDYDTDLLKNGRVLGDVYIEPVERKKKDANGQYTDEPELDREGNPVVMKFNKVSSVGPIS